jgi:hypothetical protein
MNTFSQAVAASNSAQVRRTENGAKAWATSDSKVLDLFGKIGSSRGRDMTAAFSAALAEDENLAVRTLLWARDVRSGAGERQTFRNLLRALEVQNPSLAGRIMHKVPELGRFDDLFAYQDPINRRNALRMYADALMNGDGLAAKWAPRMSSSKKATTTGKQEKLKNARALMKFMMLSPKEYRQILVGATRVVESLMCAKRWDEVNFSHVPSLASARYQKAFGKNAADAYSAYIRELQKPQEERDPKVKINAGAVYPYDVLKSLRRGNEAVANAQFEALPNFVGDSKIMPMVDVSGSMATHRFATDITAYDIALSLGLYLSSKTSSDFKDMFITFTSSATIQVLEGSLSQKMRQMQGAVGYDTNLTKAFDSLLQTAKRGNVSPENMPDFVVVLSDMQFNDMNIKGTDATALQMARQKYRDAGYECPKLIFWNLAARASADQSPVKMTDFGVCMVSGFSPAIMATVLGANPDDYTPYAMMLKVIDNSRYDF